MRVTQWGEYGILFCLYIARNQSDKRVTATATLPLATVVPAAESSATANPHPVGAQEIATAHSLAPDYTQQILHRLRKGEVISSVRGPKGGFVLARAPEQITLKQVLTAAEGHTFEVLCESAPIHANCKEAANCCGLRTVWNELQAAVDQVLEGRTIADLIAIEEASGKNSVFSRLVEGPHRKGEESIREIVG